MKSTGLAKDIEKNYKEAIEAYKLEIESENASESIYINLAFLYWIIANDFCLIG